MIPLITLGIPGSIVTAILLGALVLHDLNPGPLLFTSDPEIVYGIMASSFVANIFMFFIMIGGSLIMVRLVDIPRAILQPLLIVFCVIGTFALNNRFFDVWVMFGFGNIGFFLEKAKIPLGPFIIGFILSNYCRIESALESYVREWIAGAVYYPSNLACLSYYCCIHPGVDTVPGLPRKEECNREGKNGD